jgi:hypothetical protein
VVLKVKGVQRIYELNRANGHIDSDQLVVHTLTPSEDSPLSVSSKSSTAFAEQFARGLNLQEEAIGYDALEALPRYQFVHELFQHVPNGAWSDTQKLELYSRAEIKLQELIKLKIKGKIPTRKRYGISS